MISIGQTTPQQILPAAHTFLPAVHNNLACGANSPPRISHESLSGNLIDLKRKRSREVLLSFAKKRFY